MRTTATQNTNLKTRTKMSNLTWGTSLSFSMSAGSHALVLVNHTAVMLWLSGGGLETRALYGVVDFITFSSNKTTITVSVTTDSTITAFYIEV